jgi:hypothetical protein
MNAGAGRAYRARSSAGEGSFALEARELRQQAVDDAGHGVAFRAR